MTSWKWGKTGMGETGERVNYFDREEQGDWRHYRLFG